MTDHTNDIDALLAQLRRLKAYDSRYDYERHFDTLVALVAERNDLREQRDEARKDVCRLIALEREEKGLQGSCDPKVIAAERGYEGLFEEEA